MVLSVTVPRLGPGMSPAFVPAWERPDGAPVAAGDVVVSVECDDVVVEVEAEGDGVLRHRAQAGRAWEPGALLGMVLAPGERIPDGLRRAPEPPAAAEPSAAEPAAAIIDFTAGPPPSAEPVAPQDPPRRGAEPIPLRPRARKGPPPSPGGSFIRAAVPDFPGGYPFAAPCEEPQPLGLAGPLAHVQPAEVFQPEWIFESAALAGADSSEEEPEPLPPAGAIPLRGASVPEPMPQMALVPMEGWTPALYMRASVNMAEVLKMRAQLAREWRASGLRPADEDVVVRALARAIREHPGLSRHASAVAVCLLEEEAPTFYRLDRPASRGFREAVAAMAEAYGAGGDPEPGCTCTVTPLAEFGVDEGLPRLREGQVLSVTMGATRNLPALEGDRRDQAPMMVLTLAYNGLEVSEVMAARLLARLRELVESPYALFID